MELGTRTSYETSYRVVFASGPADKKRNLRPFGLAASFVEVALLVVVTFFVLAAFLVVVAFFAVVVETSSVAKSFATCSVLNPTAAAIALLNIDSTTCCSSVPIVSMSTSIVPATLTIALALRTVVVGFSVVAPGFVVVGFLVVVPGFVVESFPVVEVAFFVVVA